MLDEKLEINKDKLSVYMFYILNLFVMIPYVVKHLSIKNFIYAVVLFAAEYYFSCYVAKAKKNGSSYLIQYVLLDFSYYFVINYPLLKEQASAIIAGEFINRYGAVLVLIVLFSLILLFMQPKLMGIFGCCILVLGTMFMKIIMGIPLDGTVSMESQQTLIYYSYVINSLILLLIFKLSIYGNEEAGIKNAAMYALSIILLTVLYIIFIQTKNVSAVYIIDFVSSLPKLIFSVIVLYAASFLLEENKIDSYALFSVATLLIVLKVSFVNYFIYNIWFIISFILLLIFGAKYGSRYEADNGNGKTAIGFCTSIGFLSIFLLLLLSHGYWMYAILFLMFVLYAKNTNLSIDSLKDLRRMWTIIVVFVVVSMLLLNIKRAYSVDMLWMYLLIGTVCALCFYIYNYKYKECTTYVISIYSTVTMCVIILCTFINIPTINVDDTIENDKIHIVASTKSEENKIQTIEYYWKDKKGNMVSDIKKSKKEDFSLKIINEKLTVKLIDKYGIVRTIDYYFPIETMHK